MNKKLTPEKIERYQLDNIITFRKLPFERDEPRPERVIKDASFVVAWSDEAQELQQTDVIQKKIRARFANDGKTHLITLPVAIEIRPFYSNTTEE